jgi:hypothetical protein
MKPEWYLPCSQVPAKTTRKERRKIKKIKKKIKRMGDIPH